MGASDYITLVVAIIGALAGGYGAWSNRAKISADAAASNVDTALKLRDEIQRALAESLERLKYLESSDDRKDAELDQMRTVIRQQERRITDQARRITDLETADRLKTETIEKLKQQLAIEKGRVTRLRGLLAKNGINLDTGEF